MNGCPITPLLVPPPYRFGSALAESTGVNHVERLRSELLPKFWSLDLGLDALVTAWTVTLGSERDRPSVRRPIPGEKR